ncbi:hypothetical protein I0C86_41105 [Plantactinospora sp. S1510]|uniref:Uncharacterized protein n=1 Tax=Plantactinospora alkalitolerans TaxID=2789879 RepID=A0ABS0H9U8_9ACTN|nr:hypothetical protein [Plantactinospora alkalitolerans]MBF9135251.1 hypothetical protein [Plantactinospora alkalitolerans]
MSQLDDAREQFVRQFAHTDNPAWYALKYLAQVSGIGIAWIDRTVVEHQLGRELTEEEWADVGPRLDDYDKYIGDFDQAPEDAFIDKVLSDACIDWS